MSKKKILQAVATIGAVTATGTIATTAHADTTPATSNTAVSQAPSADQQLSNLQASQAKAEQSLADQNQATLKSQTATIEQQASEAANKENAAYSSAVASQSAANQKELANAAQHIVTPAQKAQQESAAKIAYDKSKADLDAQHSAKSNQIKADYDAAVKKTTDDAKANQTTAEQQHTQEVQDATKAVSDAQNKVNNLTQLNNQKQTELTNAKNELDEVNSTTNDESSKDSFLYLNSHKKFHMSPLYISTLKDTSQYPDPTFAPGFGKEISNNTAIIETPTAEEAEKQNYDTDLENLEKYTTDFSGSNQYYTPIYQDDQGALIPESSKKLTVYAAYLINQLRAQAGYPLVHVNQKYLDYGYQLMHIYNQDMTGDEMDNMDHDAEGFQDFAKTHNIIWIGGTINGIGLGGSDKTVTINGQTVHQLRINLNGGDQAIASSLNDLLLNDSTEHFGHARSLLGVTDSVDGPYVPYLAVNTDNDGNCQIMIFYVRPNTADQAQDLDVSANAIQPNPGKSSSDSAKTLQAAQTAYDNAYTAAQSSAKDLAQAKAALATAQAKLADLQKSQGTSATDQALQAKLNDLAKTRDAALQKENDAYNTAMNKLNADYQAKLDNIKKLPTNVDELKAQQVAHLADMKKAHEAKLAQINNDAVAKIAAYKAQLDAKLNALKVKDVQTYQALHNELFPQAQASVKSAINGSGSYMTANGQAVSFPTKSSSHSAVSEATLPQTGNSSSVAVMALGIVSAMFGFGLAKKRY